MELFVEYQTANPERKREIETLLVEEHKRLAYYVAKRYFNLFGPDDNEDIEQEAIMALLKAIRGFNPKKAIAFSTYAVVIIKNHLGHFLQKKQITCISLDELATNPEKRVQYQSFLTANDNGEQDISREDILSYLQKRMTAKQFEAFSGVLNGYSFQELAEKRDITESAIRINYNGAVRRAKKALKSFVRKY